ETISGLRRPGADRVQIIVDLVVFLGDTASAAAAHRVQLDTLLGREYISDAAVFVGTPTGLAHQLIGWHDAGADGFRLRPAALPHDLAQITDALVLELQHRGAFRTKYRQSTLRGLFGLPRPANRYVNS